MLEFLHHPYVQGAITGVVSAAVVDFAAFRSWKSFHEAHEYDWYTALWRWTQGAVVGLVSAAGIGLIPSA